MAPGHSLVLTSVKQEVVQGSIETVPFVLGPVIITSSTWIPGQQESAALAHTSARAISVHVLGRRQQPLATDSLSRTRRQPHGNSENREQTLSSS